MFFSVSPRLLEKPCVECPMERQGTLVHGAIPWKDRPEGESALHKSSIKLEDRGPQGELFPENR